MIILRMPNPIAVSVAVVTSPKDKRRVGHTLLHLINNSFLKALSIPHEHRLSNFPELTKALWMILALTVLYLVRTMAEVNLALPSPVDNL
jgi:hypothetical protein